MATCKRCGSSGRFLKVNDEGLCSLCANCIKIEAEESAREEALAEFQEATMSEDTEITVLCGNCTLRVNGDHILVAYKKKSLSIAISNIQSVSVSEPTAIRSGAIILGTAQASSSSVYLGYGVTISDGGKLTFIFGANQLTNALRLQSYIINYEKNHTTAPDTVGKAVVSVVDEIRGLKVLLDEGILTQEEFDAKKKQLLNL